MRSWRRRPGLSATLVCTLAVGLGLGAAIFSFADGYLFRPLPFHSPDQLYFVRDSHARIASLLAGETNALRRSDVGVFGFVEWSTAARISANEMIVDGRQVRVLAYEVTPAFGQVLRIPLVAGRLFEDADHQDGAAIGAWISHRFWQRELGGDPTILNRSYRVTGGHAVDVTIVGILDRGVASFDLNNAPPDLVVPALVEVAPQVVNRNALSFPIVRLPGTMTRAEGEARISAALQAVAPPGDGRPRAVRLRPLRDVQVQGGQPTARVLFAGALLVLLLVAINVAHLLLAQGVARAGEIATRAALGASRWRIVRLFLVESVILGTAGTTGGLLMGAWLSEIIAARIPQYPTAGRNLALVPMVFDARVVVSAVTLARIIHE
jgi:putative ABC transport system permease protein